jgi:hypothetical protein
MKRELSFNVQSKSRKNEIENLKKALKNIERIPEKKKEDDFEVKQFEN